MESSIVVSGAMATKVAAGSSAMMAYQTQLAAPAVKATAATAGVLLVLGNPSRLQ
jgi:hypothetical protein